MTTKTDKTIAQDIATIAQDIEKFIELSSNYAMASAILADARKTMDEQRLLIVPILQKYVKVEWKILGKQVTEALKSLKVPAVDANGMRVLGDDGKPVMVLRYPDDGKKSHPDVIAWVGVFKTCHEFKIMPATRNPDNLRKAKSWVNWNGSTIPNTYKAPNKKPVKATAPSAPTAPVVSTAPTAPSAPTAPNPTVKGTPSAPKVNVQGSEAGLSQFDHWEAIAKQFTDHGLFTSFINRLAGLTGTKPDALAIAFRTASSDMVKQGRDIESKLVKL